MAQAAAGQQSSATAEAAIHERTASTTKMLPSLPTSRPRSRNRKQLAPVNEVSMMHEERPDGRSVAGETRELATDDTDDGGGLAVEPHGRAHHGRVRPEVAGPEALPEDDRGRRIRPLVTNVEESSKSGSSAQFVEKVGGDEERARRPLDASRAQTRLGLASTAERVRVCSR